MATLYDGKGNEISVNGGGTTPVPTPTPNVSSEIFDKVIVPNKIINKLDLTKVESGVMQVPPDVNHYLKNSEVSDYIQVKASNTYVAQYLNSDGKDMSEKIFKYDSEKKYTDTPSLELFANGTVHWYLYTPESDGYIRFQYRTDKADNPNPMFFLGDKISEDYIEYSSEEIDESNFYYTVNKNFKNILQRDYLQNNLYGKTIYWFGDSNSDNWASSTQRRDFEKKFGCKVRSYGTYGATWGDAENGVNSTQMIRANGQFNKFLSEVEIDSADYTFPKDSAFFFMMGTNTGTVGNMPEGGVGKITDETCTTDISAMNYILKRIRYYGRKQPIGVFIPWCIQADNREQLIKICEYYRIQYFDLTTFIPEYTRTKGLVRLDGSTVQNDYFTDGGVHLSANGWEKFRRVAENWMAYQV